MYKLCPYCQQQVPVYQWPEHEMRHRAASAPFQPAGPAHAGFAAVDPALAKHPRMYHHPRCGRTTALPEAVLAAQSRDPFSSTDYAPCSGCSRYVHTSELFFEGTGESLLAADRRQKGVTRIPLGRSSPV
jgi:hypothetical protein